MKNKKISLTNWLFLKTIPTFLLLTYYWMIVREDFALEYIGIQNFVAFLMVLFLVFSKFKKDVFDELAMKTLYKTDFLCLKFAYIMFSIILFMAALQVCDIVMLGYIVGVDLISLAIARAFIFMYYEKKGE